MGCGGAKLTKGDVQDYKELTWMNRKDIQVAWRKFQKAAPGGVLRANPHSRIPLKNVFKFKEMGVSPWRWHMCKIFSSRGDGSMTFNDFLDLYNMCCRKSPLNFKSEWVFRIYDFDDDDCIGSHDLGKATLVLTSNRVVLEEEQLARMFTHLILATDLNLDNRIDYEEFDHIVRMGGRKMKRMWRFRLI